MSVQDTTGSTAGGDRSTTVAQVGGPVLRPLGERAERHRSPSIERGAANLNDLIASLETEIESVKKAVEEARSEGANLVIWDRRDTFTVESEDVKEIEAEDDLNQGLADGRTGIVDEGGLPVALTDATPPPH